MAKRHDPYVRTRRDNVKTEVLGSFTTLVLGDRGSGKTAFMALLSETWKEHGYRIVWIFPKALVGRPWPWEVKEPAWLAKALADEARWAQLEHMAIFLDEAWVLANPRLWAKNQDRVTALSRFMAIARHVDTRVVISTQLAMGVDKALRSWSETIVLRRMSLARYYLETSRPTWLFRLDKALAMTIGHGLKALANDEAVIVASHTWLVYDIPLPSSWSEDMSKYYAMGDTHER